MQGAGSIAEWIKKIDQSQEFGDNHIAIIWSLVGHYQSLKSLILDIGNFPELEALFDRYCHYLDLELSKGHHEEQSTKLKLKYIQFRDLPQIVALPQLLQETALHSLSILNSDNLEMLPECLSTLTNLKTLHVANCPKLLSLLNNIRFLTALESLRIKGCPELCRKCQPRVGEYWPKIALITHVFIDKPKELEEVQEGSEEEKDKKE